MTDTVSANVQSIGVLIATIKSLDDREKEHHQDLLLRFAGLESQLGVMRQMFFGALLTAVVSLFGLVLSLIAK